LDTEGTFGNSPQAVNRGLALLLRLINISDVIIFNVSNHFDKAHADHILQASDMYNDEFSQDAPNPRLPHFIIFQNRANRHIQTLDKVHSYFGYRHPAAFTRLWYSNSDDRAPERKYQWAEKPVRLDTTDLHEKINTCLSERTYSKPAEIFKRLQFFDTPQLTTNIADDPDWKHHAFQCLYQCKLCNVPCIMHTIRHHIHSGTLECASQNARKTFRCSTCLTRRPPKNGVMTQLTWTWFHGYKYQCNQCKQQVDGMDWSGSCCMFLPAPTVSVEWLKSVVNYKEHEFQAPAPKPKPVISNK